MILKVFSRVQQIAKQNESVKHEFFKKEVSNDGFDRSPFYLMSSAARMSAIIRVALVLEM